MVYDQLAQSNTGQIFHRIIKDIIGGTAIIIKRNGIRMSQPAGELYLTLEQCQNFLTDLIGMNKLYGCGTTHHDMTRTINLSHTALSDALFQCVLPQCARFMQRHAASASKNNQHVRHQQHSQRR